jgi:hypothetical protein
MMIQSSHMVRVLPDGESNACARTDPCRETSRKVRIRSVSSIAVWLVSDEVDDDCLTTYRQVSKCRLYLGPVMRSFLSVLEELYASELLRHDA